MKVLVVALLTLSTILSHAQKKSLSLEGTVHAGLLEGEHGSALQFGFMGGIKTKTFTTSIGTALDYYGIRSIPLYLNVQKKIFEREHTPFFYASGGYHFPWMPASNNDWNWWTEAKTKGGLYYQAGIGYQLPAMKKAALFFAAGYSYKQYTQEITQASFCIGPGPGPCPQYKEKFEHRLRRLSVTTGLRF